MQAIVTKTGVVRLAVAAVLLAASPATSQIVFQNATTQMTNPTTGDASTTLTIPAPSSITAGDFLLAHVAFEKGTDATVTAPSGWTLVDRTDASSDLGQAIYYKFALVGDQSTVSYAWGFSQSVKAAGGILRYTGVNGTPSPIVDFSENSGDNATLVGNTVTGIPDARLVAFYGHKKLTGLSTPSGMVERYEFSNPQDVTILSADETLAGSNATGSRNSMAGDASKWVTHLVVLRATVVQLPVELTSFSVHSEGRSVRLQWRTESETGNAGFDVETRTSESGTFRRIGFVPGHGTSYEAIDYSFVVENVQPGTHQFRLKQIDLDGAFSFSSHVEATVAVPGTHFISEAYPNPFRERVRISVTVPETQRVRVELFDVAGRRLSVPFDAMATANAQTEVEIATTGLAPGLYFVRASGLNFTDIRRILRVE